MFDYPLDQEKNDVFLLKNLLEKCFEIPTGFNLIPRSFLFLDHKKKFLTCFFFKLISFVFLAGHIVSNLFFDYPCKLPMYKKLKIFAIKTK